MCGCVFVDFDAFVKSCVLVRELLVREMLLNRLVFAESF